MLLFAFLIGSVLSAPTDEFGDLLKNGGGDIVPNHPKTVMNIIPSGFPIHKSKDLKDNEFRLKLPELNSIDESNEHYNTFNILLQQGVTMKGLTFNIYDDNMREAAVSLFRLFQTIDEKDFQVLRQWAETYVNKEMVTYALRLEAIFDNKIRRESLLPPFISNPNYFVNSDAMSKISQIYKDILTTGRLNPQLSKIHQYYYTDSVDDVVINANYSGWNLPKNSITDDINYFKEDVFLNSYYLGLHLLHPFWMSNDELDQINSRHAEHYYYAHKRLLARFELEKLHLGNKTIIGRDESDYVPYLSYKNGLPFPTRSCIRRNWDDEQALLKSIDIALKECISRGIIFMENGTLIKMTEDNHIDVLARLVRANLDSVKTSKIIRNIFGYGGNIFPDNVYNPAPSLLHHPETALRDPAYWYLIEYMLKYFNEFIKKMEPFDLSAYEEEDIVIQDAQFPRMFTCFSYHTFVIDDLTQTKRATSKLPRISVMQRKLRNNVSLMFEVKSTKQDPQEVIVRLYLGPVCGENCWAEYSKFFELDTFEYTLDEGINVINWTTDSFESIHSALYYKPNLKDLNIFKFPTSLLIPRGSSEGLNFTLFIIITPAEKDSMPFVSKQYNEALPELHNLPLGFPFHRPARRFVENATNYRFYNVTIYHNSIQRDHLSERDVFSTHLY